MTRYIDADALIPMMKYATTDNEIGVFPIRIGFDAIKGVIDDASTIDAVEVVRCKDCKHQDHCYKTVAHNKRHDDFNEYWSETIEWCSKGERKEE